MKDMPTVLYVDDEEYNLLLLKVLFRGTYDVIVADSGSKALDILSEKNDIDAIITDMNMPKMNGLEFINQARKINDSVPFIIFSGYDMNEEIFKAIENGTVECHLQKPINKDKIIKAVNNAMVR